MRVLPPDTAPDAPWKQRFRVPSFLWAVVATGNPSRGIAWTHRDEEYQLYAWDVPTGDLRPVTDRPGGVATGWLAPDGSSIVWLQDTDGNEIGHFVRASWGGGEPEDLTPTLPPYASFSADTSLSGRFLSVIADEAGSHLLVVDPGASSPRIVWSTTKLCWGAAITADGSLGVVCVASHSSEPRMNLVAVDLSSGTEVGELWDGDGTSILEAICVPDQARHVVAATSDRSGSSRALIWDIDNGDRVDVDLPGSQGDVVPVAWSARGDRLLLQESWRAVDSLWLHDDRTGASTKLAHPSGTYGPASFGPAGEILACREAADEPAHVVTLDGRSGARVGVALSAGAVPPSTPWRSVEVEGAGGDAIQMWVSVPDGAGPFPTIIETHGGPQSIARETYVPRAQAWTDHGYAYASVNYHGSWGFGRAFLESIWGRPGELEIDDLVASRACLIAQGVADAAAVLVTGWSYGGYLTLQAMGTRPDLWQGGMAGIAIGDWSLMYRDGSDALKAYQVGLLGGEPEERPEVYRSSSPISSVGRLEAPVLVIQGRNDSRCPASQMEAYEAAARAAGKDVTIDWFDSGHAGWSDVEESIRHVERMLSFASSVVTKVSA